MAMCCHHNASAAGQDIIVNSLFTSLFAKHSTSKGKDQEKQGKDIVKENILYIEQHCQQSHTEGLELVWVSLIWQYPHLIQWIVLHVVVWFQSICISTTYEFNIIIINTAATYMPF